MEKAKNNFEDSMKRLEEIANDLENDELTLDEAVSKFEEGMKLSKKCKELLEEAEKKITVLVGDKEEEFKV